MSWPQLPDSINPLHLNGVIGADVLNRYSVVDFNEATGIFSAATPEPSAFVPLLAISLLGLAWRLRHRRALI